MRVARGFTIIELLIVLVIIAILASIAIPRFTSARSEAFVAQMQSDLRNLQSAQELHYTANDYVYASDVASLEGFTSSPDVTVTIVSGTSTGWSATASHANTDVTCDVFVGDAASPGISTDAGVVTCSGGD